MKTRILAVTAFVLTASVAAVTPAVFAQSASVAAPAAWTAESLAAKYQADGYSRVEIKFGPSQAKIEAFNGATKLEETYELSTGRVIKTETYQLASSQAPSPGVFVRTLDDNPGGGNHGGSGDHSEDDHDDDHHGGQGSDDDGSDDRGSGHGGDR